MAANLLQIAKVLRIKISDGLGDSHSLPANWIEIETEEGGFSVLVFSATNDLIEITDERERK